MLELSLIGMAAGCGAVARYSFSRLNNLFNKVGFPLGTYLVNLIGCLLIGWIFGKHFNEGIYRVIATGFCGGLTTFSTFNFELFDLLDKHDYRHFAEYFILSYGLGFVVLIMGLLLAK